jgi:septal ring-binding cell division protein DamX
MPTPSLSLVESLIGAIPVEEGAALVARVGERATITAKSGSIEVGSVALTVEAMDDLIAQVLPPDQLESLRENGTVHFEFTPPAIGGEFAVLAASTPGDRWLEIRRRNPSIATATAPVTEVVRAAVAPPPTAAPVPAVAAEADVVQLLSRFHTPEPHAAAPGAPAPALSAPVAPAPRPSFAAAPPPLDFDFDLSAKMATPPPSPAPVPAVQEVAVNDDLSIPASFDFPEAKSDFDLDGLSLPEVLPERPLAAAFDSETPAVVSDHSEHIAIRHPETSGMAKSFTSSPLRSRSVVMLSVVLGVVVLSAAGWFAAQRYLSAPSVAVAAPPPAPRKPAPPKAGPQKAAGAPATAAASRRPAAAAPVATPPAAKRGTETVAQNPDAVVTPKPVPPPAVAKAYADTAAPKTTTAPATPPSTATAAAPAPGVPHEGFAIQVAAVRERDEADRIVARLVNQGYSGYLVRGQGAAAAFYRVRVGAFKDRQAAEEVAVRLERAEGVKPWIVKETP